MSPLIHIYCKVPAVFFFSVEPKQFSKLFRLGEIQKSALRVENFENCLGWGKSEKVLMILFEKVEKII